MRHNKAIYKQRQRRSFRVRKRTQGSTTRPRLSVFRSHKHIYAQVIDDTEGRTLAAASTVEADVRSGIKFGGNKAAAEAVGKAIAERLISAGIRKIAFDRGSCQYHGRVAALATAARAAGLEF